MSKIITKQGESVIGFFKSLDRMLDGLEQLVANHKPSLKGETYITDKELSERLNISRRTLQEWRNDGLIEYIQFEGKIIYAESAIHKLLDKHRRKSWE